MALSLPSTLAPMTATQQDRQIAETVRQQRPRLLQFIRRRIPDEAEAEDLLQDVFAELVESYRLLKPVEQAAAWLFRVARNRITDLYRRKRPVSLEEAFGAAMAGRMEHLSPEKREKFRLQMQQRCGMGWTRRPEPAAETKVQQSA